LECLGSQSHFINIFMSFHLEQCIWHKISRWIWQRNCIKLCADLGKTVTETLAMIGQAFGEESMRRTRKVQTHRDRNGGDRLMLIWHRGDCSQFVLAGQTVTSAYSATEWKCAKTLPRYLATNELAVPSWYFTPQNYDYELKRGRRAGNSAYVRKGATSRVIVVSRYKVFIFLLGGGTSPGNYGWLFVRLTESGMNGLKLITYL
jgi:hypothetical protein